MEKTGNIWDMVKEQGQRSKISCPACNNLVVKCKLNYHLDVECSSLKISNNAMDFKTKSRSINEDSLLVSEDLTKNLSYMKSLAPSKRKRSFAKKIDEKQSEIRSHKICYQSKSSTSTDDIQRKKVDFVLSKCEKTAENKTELPIDHRGKSAPNTSRSWMLSSKIYNFNEVKRHKVKEPIHETESEKTSKNSEIEIRSLNILNDETSIENIQTADVFPQVESKTARSPYYVSNFKFIIKIVLGDENNKHLFNDNDLDHVKAFNAASDAAQQLFARLFQRKFKWLRSNKIVYPQIADELSSVLAELEIIGLLDSGEDDIDLTSALNLLSLPEAKSLSKIFNFNATGISKTEIIELLLKQAKQHKPLFFSRNGDNSVSSAILKRVNGILGPCYRLSMEPRRLFTRILMLFSLPTMSEDDEEASGGQQQQLFTLLQVNRGDLIFPDYKMRREYIIFEDRESLLRYEVARELENTILHAVEEKSFDNAKVLYLKAKEVSHTLVKSKALERDKELPFFLKRYTASHVYTRCMNHGVEVLQRLRQYNEAVDQLKELLDQTVYCQDRRGKWWDRLALNLDQHLKLPIEAADAIKTALHDDWVRVAYRLALVTRAERLCKRKNAIDDDQLKVCTLEKSCLHEAPMVTIRGSLLPTAIPNRRHVFVSSLQNEGTTEGDVTVLGVEQLAIAHYKTVGFSKGLHGEGSTFISLYALLFWDVIYNSDVPDVFISPYQAHPLDLNSNCFFENREAAIIERLSTIKNANTQTLKEMVSTTWSLHNGEASLVSWNNFNVEDILELISSFGSHILAGICERLAKDFRFTRSGVPDLVVWNPESLTVKVVEVKGPGDKLSFKQILWLDYLLRLGSDAEVCHVAAVGAKSEKIKNL